MARAWLTLTLESQLTEIGYCKSKETYSVTQAVPGKHPHCCLKWSDLYFNPLYIYFASGLSSSGPGIYLAGPQK